MIDPASDISDIYSRIGMLEHVLEVLLANEMAQWPESQSNGFKRELLARPARLTSGPGPAAPDAIQASAERVRGALAHFLRKASDREAEIRARLSRGH